MMWHVLDVRCVWVREFALALSERDDVLGWWPQISWAGSWRTRERRRVMEPGIRVQEFPLQRGFARFPVSCLCDEGRRIARRIGCADRNAHRSPLVVCSPHYAGAARQWAGPTIYYATDMFRFCGERQHRIERMEAALCDRADLVCPNSRRIADYMTRELGVAAGKIVVLPNATRAENLLPACPPDPFPLPLEAADLPRPVAGVIGNLAANTDWQLLERTITAAPWLAWVFVGPTAGKIWDEAQRAARTRVMHLGPRVRFVGEQPYGRLRDYARSFDVAVLPYSSREPTCSGSSTRFYEHLAACRPMVATRGVEELHDKPPLVTLVDGPPEMIRALERLRNRGFRDGCEELRWATSRHATLEARILALRDALESRNLVARREERPSGAVPLPASA